MKGAGIKKISCLIGGNKAWVILMDRKLVGWAMKLDGGDFKWSYQARSPYGAAGLAHSLSEAIEALIECGYF